MDAVLRHGRHTAAGPAVTLTRDVWNGGALPVAVTIAGWATLLKGAALLLVPAERMADSYKGAGFERFVHLWMVVVLALGLWMSWAAFTG